MLIARRFGFQTHSNSHAECDDQTHISQGAGGDTEPDTDEIQPAVTGAKRKSSESVDPARRYVSKLSHHRLNLTAHQGEAVKSHQSI